MKNSSTCGIFVELIVKNSRHAWNLCGANSEDSRHAWNLCGANSEEFKYMWNLCGANSEEFKAHVESLWS